jgi:hypothetical protein
MTAYIYESPDGGETVYQRKSGKIDRELHWSSHAHKNLQQELQNAKLWGNIHRAAQTDPVLQEMLDQIEIYHTLKNTP